MSAVWTEQERSELRRLVKQRAPLVRIVARLKRSADAVDRQMRRMGLL